mgnify:CR=1 FL=1
MKEQSDIDRAFYLEVIRKECKQVKAELAAVREERDEYAECFEEFKELAYDARDELAAARAELRARDEAIADSDQRARWRLAQKPYTGIGEP